MEAQSYIIILISLCMGFLVSFIITLLLISFRTPTKNIPPGPPTFHLPFNLLWQNKKSFFELGPIISSLRQRYGPIIAVKIGSEPTIFIGNNTLAHEALIDNGTAFADRPETAIADVFFPNKRKGICQSPFGTTWRVLRHNLTCSSGILHPFRVKSFNHLRKRVLEDLIGTLKQESEHGYQGVYVHKHFKHAIFSLLVLMCLGENVEENKIRELEDVQNRLCMLIPRLNIFAMMSKFGKFVFRNRWNELLDITKVKEDVLAGMIRERKKIKQANEEKDIDCESYVDTLLELRLPGDQKIVEEREIMSLSDEFICAGADKTTTALHWIMANIVKYPKIQAKIVGEINGVVEQGQEWIKENDLLRMPYLKAVVLEGLRCHPPVYFLATPHAVAKDVELRGYHLPKGTSVNFLVADMGRDPNLWEDPLEFKPERFLFDDEVNNVGGVGNHFDITGSREIKMMPFGAGRRICPGLGLATLHLEYFAANLIWHFKWAAVGGDRAVDLSEKLGFTVGMKNPLHVHLAPRVKKLT